MDYYGTVDEFRDYHTARGRDVSAYTDDVVIGAALLVASEWIDGSFAGRFTGLKTGQRAQVREWPRYSVLDREGYPVDSVTVPIEIEQATYEAALRDLQAPGSLSVDYTPNKYDSVSIEGAVSVKYRRLDAMTVQTQYPVIGRILSRLLSDGSGYGLSGRLIRA